MATVSRNDPCPCGSGQKYKRCCLGKAAPLKGKRLLWSALLIVVAVGAAVTISVLDGLTTGLGAGAVLLLLAGILYIVRSPPPSGGGKSGASDINFGR
jgi:hypothetical protein